MSQRAKQKKKLSNKKGSARKKTAIKKAYSPISFEFNNLSYIVLGLVAVAFFIRLINVGVLSLWVDEYVHVSGIKNFLAGKGSIIPYDGNSGLLNFFILPFFALFGDSAFWSRLPSVFFGAGGVYAIFLLGKELFNKKVGLYAAVILMFSLYAIFWSRMTRAYSLFAFLYLLTIYFFYRAFEPKNIELTGIWDKYKIDPKQLLFFVISFLLAITAHKLALITAFSIGFYIIFRAILDLFEKDKRSFWSNKYQLLAIPVALFYIVFFTPALSGVFRPLLAVFVPDNFVNWFLPNWAEIGALWESERYKVFDIYKNLINYDYKGLYWFGIAGLPLAFLANKKGALVQICFFVVPLLLMSFVLRGVYNPRYLAFLYPVFLISSAVTLYFIFHYLFKKYAANLYHSKLNYLLYFLPILIVLFFVRFTEIKDLITVKHKSGYLVDKKLSTWSFTNWKDPVNYLKANMQDGDVVMATIPSAADYYMGWDDGGTIQFRQRYFNTEKKQHTLFEEPSNNLNAHTVENLTRTIREHPRGWLLADYYFDNVMTTQEARNIVFQNMDLNFDATPTGDVLVYSWDRNKPRPYGGQNIVLVVGTNPNKMASKKLNFNVTEQLKQKPTIKVQVAIQANSYPEAFFVINEKWKYYVPANTSKTIQKFDVEVKTEHLNTGQNTIQFGYEGKPTDPRKGYAVHSISFL